MKTQSFDIVGSSGHLIPTLLTRHGGAGLAVFLPGLRYGNDRPVLHFTQKMFAERGYDVLTVNYSYPGIAEFMDATEADQSTWLDADARAILSFVRGLASSQSLVVVGKSIGTALMAHMVPQLTQQDTTRLVWLTPLLRGSSEFVRMQECHQASFLAIGTADPGYDADMVARFRAQGHTAQVFEALDHGLEKPGSVSASIAALAALLIALEQWLTP